MKRKLMMVLACAMAAVTLLPASASAQTTAASFMANNTNPVVTKIVGSCTMDLQYGEFSTTRLARMYNPNAQSTCSGDSFVELISTKNTPSFTQAIQRCHVNTALDVSADGTCSVPYGSPGKWYQANVAGSINITGARFHLCPSSGACQDFRYTIFTADPVWYTDTNFSHAGCDVDITQGTYLTAAYARIKENSAPFACNTNSTWIELTYVSDEGELGVERCYLNSSLNDTTQDADGWCNSYSGWTQAQFDGTTGHDAHLARVTIHLCDTNGTDCTDRSFNSF
jgi:hypothetical protein